jgi:hypothetical protein
MSIILNNSIIESINDQTIFSIEKMNALLTTFNIYLDQIKLDINDQTNFKYLYEQKENQKILEKYMNIIIQYYNKNEKNNIDIRTRFIYSILNGIIILFSYLYIENELLEKSINIDEYIKLLRKSTISFLLRTIDFNNYIIEKFINILGIDNIKTYNLVIIINILQHNSASLLSNFFKKFNKIFSLLLQIFRYINETDNLITNNYITIPQYEGICWFISFLTAICYSDESKKLLLNKYKTYNKYNIKNINMITFDENPLITLNTFVYYIIRDITLPLKVYDPNQINENCHIFKYLKKLPSLFLIQLCNTFIQYYINKKNKTYDTLFNYNETLFKHNENFFTSFIKDNKLNYKPITINNNINQIGIVMEDYTIINIFYKYLNIKPLYLFLYKNKLYVQRNINITDTSVKNPDIIIIHSITSMVQFYKLSIIEFSNTAIKYNSNNFTYNEQNYVLDYMILPDSSKYKCKECNAGHCISAIHYNNIEYLYNSSDTLITLNDCTSINDIRIPCSLIEFKWKSSISNDYCIKLDKCHFDNVNTNSKSFKTFCYEKNGEKILCFVKEQEIPSETLEDVPKHIVNENNSSYYNLSDNIYISDDNSLINLIKYIIEEYSLNFRTYIFKFLRGNDRDIKLEIKEYEEIFIEKFIYLINYPISANNGTINKDLNNDYFNYIMLYNKFFYNIIQFCRSKEEDTGELQLKFIRINNLLNSIIKYLQTKGSNFEYNVLSIGDYIKSDYDISNYEKDIMTLSKFEIKKINSKIGGNNINKYKNTGNKVTILYNKKKYNRVVYVNNRKKYVKINKVYILLSKLKKVIIE